MGGRSENPVRIVFFHGRTAAGTFGSTAGFGLLVTGAMLSRDRTPWERSVSDRDAFNIEEVSAGRPVLSPSEL